MTEKEKQFAEAYSALTKQQKYMFHFMLSYNDLVASTPHSDQVVNVLSLWYTSKNDGSAEGNQSDAAREAKQGAKDDPSAKSVVARGGKKGTQGKRAPHEVPCSPVETKTLVNSEEKK